MARLSHGMPKVGDYSIAGLVHGGSLGFCEPSAAHGVFSSSAAGGHEPVKPSQVALSPRRGASQPNHAILGGDPRWTARAFPVHGNARTGEELVASHLYQVHLYRWLLRSE